MCVWRMTNPCTSKQHSVPCTASRCCALHIKCRPSNGRYWSRKRAHRAHKYVCCSLVKELMCTCVAFSLSLSLQHTATHSLSYEHNTRAYTELIFPHTTAGLDLYDNLMIVSLLFFCLSLSPYLPLSASVSPRVRVCVRMCVCLSLSLSLSLSLLLSFFCSLSLTLSPFPSKTLFSRCVCVCFSLSFFLSLTLSLSKALSLFPLFDNT